MSLVLRAFQANGVDYNEGMRWMGLDRRHSLGDGDVAALAWALHADVDDVRNRLTILEWRGGGRWVHLAGQRLSRWIAPTTMLAKVCPACLREAGFARISWLTRAVPACHRHGYSLIRECASCGKPIRWARPAVRICRCSRFFKAAEAAMPAEPEMRAWLNWTEAVLKGDTPTAADAMQELPRLLHDLTLDGAYRMVEVFGLLETSADPVRDVRHISASLHMGSAVVLRGLRRLACADRPDDVGKLLFEVASLPVLKELADTPACEIDGQRAAWLLDVYRAARPSGLRRVGARPKRQLPLFL